MGGKGSGGIRKGSVSDPMLIEPGDNSSFLLNALAVQNLGAKKVDLLNPDEVRERIGQYFQLMAESDKKPTMGGLALALGFTRTDEINRVMNNQPTERGRYYGYTEDGCPKETKELLQKAKTLMATLWEDYMQSGKINPASGIFLGKNFYGMRDVVENVITPNVNPADNYDADEIARRYLAESRSADLLPDGETPPDDPFDDIPPG